MAAIRLKFDPATLGNLISRVEHVVLRPGMYFGSPTLFQATEFLAGFRVAIDAAFDATILDECRAYVLEARGYKTRSHWHHDLAQEIQDRISEERDRAVELLGLELEAWKRLRELTH